MSPTLGRTLQRRSTKAVVDTSLLVCFGFTFYTATSEGTLDPNRVLHSWTGLALVPLLAVHLASNASWITRLWRNKRRDREAGLAALNLLLAATMLTCITTGILLWLDRSDTTWITETHEASGFISIAIVIAHLVMNRRRIARLARG
jgi:hypothetical protein